MASESALSIFRGPLSNTASALVVGVKNTYKAWNLDPYSQDYAARPGIKQAWQRTSPNSADVVWGAFTARYDNVVETIILIQPSGSGNARLYSVNTETGTLLNAVDDSSLGALSKWTGRSPTPWQFTQRGGYIFAINATDGLWRKKIVAVGSVQDGDWQQVETRLFAPGVISSDVNLTRPAPDYPVHFLDSTNHTYETFASPDTTSAWSDGTLGFAAGTYAGQVLDIAPSGGRPRDRHEAYIGANIKFETGSYATAPPTNTGSGTADLPGSAADAAGGGINMENQRYLTFEVELTWEDGSDNVTEHASFDTSRPTYCFISQFPSTLRNGWGPCNPPYNGGGPPYYMDDAPSAAWDFYPGDATAHADVTKGWINARAYMSTIELWGDGGHGSSTQLPKRVLITIDLEQTWNWNGTGTKYASTLKNVRQICFFFPIIPEYGLLRTAVSHVRIKSPKFGGVWQNKGYYTDQLTFYDSDRPNLIAPKDIKYVLTTEISGADNSPAFYRIQAPYGVGAIPAGGIFPLGAIHSLSIPDGTTNPICLYRQRDSNGGRWYRIFRNTGVATTFEDHLVDVTTDIVNWGQTAYARAGETLTDAEGNVGGIVPADFDFGAGVRQALPGTSITTWRNSLVIGGVAAYPGYVFVSDRVYENQFLYPASEYRGGVVQGVDDPFIGNTFPISANLGDSAENLFGDEVLYIVGSQGAYSGIGILPSDIDIPRLLAGSTGQIDVGASAAYHGGVLVATARGLYWQTYLKGAGGATEGAYPPGELLTADIYTSWQELVARITSTAKLRVFVIDDEILVTCGAYFLFRGTNGVWEPGAFTLGTTGDATTTGSSTFPTFETCQATLDTSNDLDDRIPTPTYTGGIFYASGVHSAHCVTNDGRLCYLWRDPSTKVPFKSDNGTAIKWYAQPGDVIQLDPAVATNTAGMIVSLNTSGTIRLAIEGYSGLGVDKVCHNDWSNTKINQGVQLPASQRLRLRIGGSSSAVSVPYFTVKTTGLAKSLAD